MIGKSKKKVGRPTKLTLKLQEEMVELLKSGNYIETVCGLVGINKTTFYLWLKNADASTRSTKYSRFRDAVSEAMAFSEARLVALIARAAEKDWRAAVWMLERRQPERWGKPEVKAEKPEVESEVPEHVNGNVDHISKEDQVIIKEALGIIAMGKCTNDNAGFKEAIRIVESRYNEKESSPPITSKT